MAIWRDGYNSHCNLMERHKALVAEWDIWGQKSGNMSHRAVLRPDRVRVTARLHLDRIRTPVQLGPRTE